MDGQFHGPVTVRRALEQSLNVPAVRVAMDLGPDRVVTVAHAIGIEHPLSPVPSLALSLASSAMMTKRMAGYTTRRCSMPSTSRLPRGRWRSCAPSAKGSRNSTGGDATPAGALR